MPTVPSKCVSPSFRYTLASFWVSACTGDTVHGARLGSGGGGALSFLVSRFAKVSGGLVVVIDSESGSLKVSLELSSSYVGHHPLVTINSKIAEGVAEVAFIIVIIVGLAIGVTIELAVWADCQCQRKVAWSRRKQLAYHRSCNSSITMTDRGAFDADATLVPQRALEKGPALGKWLGRVQWAWEGKTYFAVGSGETDSEELGSEELDSEELDSEELDSEELDSL